MAKHWRFQDFCDISRAQSGLCWLQGELQGGRRRLTVGNSVYSSSLLERDGGVPNSCTVILVRMSKICAFLST